MLNYWLFQWQESLLCKCAHAGNEASNTVSRASAIVSKNFRGNILAMHNPHNVLLLDFFSKNGSFDFEMRIRSVKTSLAFCYCFLSYHWMKLVGPIFIPSISAEALLVMPVELASATLSACFNSSKTARCTIMKLGTISHHPT